MTTDKKLMIFLTPTGMDGFRKTSFRTDVIKSWSKVTLPKRLARAAKNPAADASKIAVVSNFMSIFGDPALSLSPVVSHQNGNTDPQQHSQYLRPPEHQVDCH